MKIDLLLMHKYCSERVASINITIDTIDNEPIVEFAIGERKRTLNYEDFEAILSVNKIIGKGGLLETLSHDKELKRERAVYETLSKYVLQLLFASRGKNLYRGIIPLDKHKEDFCIYHEDALS